MGTNNDTNKHVRGALLAFVVLQLVYLFFFFIRFPDSFRNAVGMHFGAADTIASWLSTLTMLGYCITCLGSVAQLVMKRPAFLLWFQISGAVALGGNFIVYVLRQIVDEWYYYNSVDYYWMLFIMALFWTVIWCMYFARSSRVFSYMGQDPTYLKMGFFTKNVKVPDPWVEPRPNYPVYPPYPTNYQQQQAPPPPPVAPPQAPPYPPVYPPVNTQPAPYPPPADGQTGYPMPGAPVSPPPVQQPPSVAQPGYPTPDQQPGYPPPAPQPQYPPYSPYGMGQEPDGSQNQNPNQP